MEFNASTSGLSSRAGRRRFTVAETLQYVSDIEDESDIDEFDDAIDDAKFVPKIANLQDAVPLSDEEESESDAEDPLLTRSNTSVSSNIGSTSKDTRKIIWKHVLNNDDIYFPATSFEGPPLPENESERLPIEYFNDFISEELKETIVEQSNLYSLQRDITKPLNLTVPEFEQWLGMAMHFSLSKISNTVKHWSRSFCNEAVSGIMSRDRWLKIKTKLHLTDNEKADPTDYLYKIRPLVKELQTKFRQIPMIEHLSVDEQMVPFKGKSWMKQYIPKKPHKWGYKLFLLCDSSGLVYDFMIYAGGIRPVEKPGVPDLGASSNSVLHLAQTIPPHQNHKLFFDNWFTSLPLINYLAKQGIWCCGTVQARRIPGLKFKTDKDLKREGRGSEDVWKANVEGTTVTAVKWQDTRSVCVVSTYLSHKPNSSCLRFDRKEKITIEVPRPHLISVYNQKMGGVDLQDQMISYYRMAFKSRKYYQRMVFHLLDMTVVNAWNMYRRDASNMGIPKAKANELFDFKSNLASSLMKGGKVPSRRRGRPSSISVETQFKKKKKTGNATKPIPQQDIRLDNVGHLPSFSDSRATCKLPRCSGKVFMYCTKCEVHLCCSRGKDCFYQFHTV